MAEVTIEISEDLKEEIKKHAKVAWSKILEKTVRGELNKRAERQIVLAALNKLLEKSTLTEKDALELGSKANEEMYKRLKEEGLI